jgi:phytoene dehydrogenase-like protein
VSRNTGLRCLLVDFLSHLLPPIDGLIADICIIGGGVAGLTAAITAAEQAPQDTKIILLEADSKFGGRVQSDVTDDGFVLDRGFAVFIEEYPLAKQLLDYDKLELGKFQPGALVKLPGKTELVKVADPLRQPQDILTAITAPVGTLEDKLKVMNLLIHVFTNDVSGLFQEEETSTLVALQDRWGFSSDMIDKFYKPFLEGIYLAPLEQQSSRMFHFVMKMFSQGAATLPKGGIGAVAQQLKENAAKTGVDLRCNATVTSMELREDGRFEIELADKTSVVVAKTVIVATDGKVSDSLLSQVDSSIESSVKKETQPHRSVGCLYYTFDGPPPVADPILILSGIGIDRGTPQNPVNNICFPSVVNPSYAPKGKSLCSVTVLKTAMDYYRGREADLDLAVRRQLDKCFPNKKVRSWKLKRIYYIENAQPSQMSGPMPATVDGGRDCTSYRGVKLPPGLYCCGDHMATATLNGALESGVKAGREAASTAAPTAAHEVVAPG